MIPAPQVGTYSTRRGEEQFLIFNSKYNIQILLIEGLFEERNFLRRTVIGIARALALRDIGTVIPDLPGCGESLLDIGDVTIADWHEAVGDASESLFRESGRQPHIAAFRGGALLDHAANGASWWRFAPASGANLLRPLRQARKLSGTEDSDELAGYVLKPEMITDLEHAVPRAPSGACRECVLQSTGTPLWRRAEPGEDPTLVEALADDLAEWARTCAAA